MPPNRRRGPEAFFFRRLSDGASAISRYVNDTWQPIASFGSDISTGVQQIYHGAPAPVRTALRTTGIVLGAALDPVGTVFNAAVGGLQRVLASPVGRPVVATIQQAAARGAQAWVDMQQYPAGRAVAGIWNNSFGHPQFGPVLSGMTTGASRVVQTVTNGGLGLLAAGVVNGQTKIGSFVAGNPRELPPELAQVYRQIAIVPRGMTINYATVPVPGTPNGRVTLWNAGGMYLFMRPGLPGEPGTTQLSNALGRTASGRIETNTWVSFLATGPAAYGGIAVNLTPNLGVQRSAWAALGYNLAQFPVVQVRPGGAEPDALIPGRTAPVFDPKVIASIRFLRVGVTDTVNVPLRIGDRTVPISAQIFRLRAPVSATGALTAVNQNANGSWSLAPRGSIDPNRPAAVRNLSVVGLNAGGDPQADDLQQLSQTDLSALLRFFGLDGGSTVQPGQPPRTEQK